MREVTRSFAVLALASTVAAGIAACGSSSSGSGGNQTCYPPASGLGSGLVTFTPPCDPGAGGILLTASGEVLALGGYAFPPATPSSVAFVDGWEVKFTKVIVTFDHVTLASNPDLSPSDQSRTGPTVAQVNGPWAVDLHKGGPLPGKGGSGEQAVPIAAIPNQNLNGNAAFDPAQRYAFSFDVVPATASAQNVNLDASDVLDYQDMIANGYTVLFVGTATFKGTSCTAFAPPSYDFTTLPRVVNFRFGFKTPTSYVNMQNPDNTGTPFAGEEFQRGIAVKGNTSTIAQATFHTDHVFWESFVHDSPLHFDQVAAQYVGATGTPTALLADLAAVNFQAFTDKLGNALPWRTCIGTGYAPPGPGQMTFNSLGIPYNPAASASQALRGYADFMSYDQSTFGHLNADGLAYVRRNYPSP